MEAATTDVVVIVAEIVQAEAAVVSVTSKVPVLKARIRAHALRDKVPVLREILLKTVTATSSPVPVIVIATDAL